MTDEKRRPCADRRFYLTKRCPLLRAANNLTEWKLMEKAALLVPPPVEQGLTEPEPLMPLAQELQELVV